VCEGAGVEVADGVMCRCRIEICAQIMKSWSHKIYALLTSVPLRDKLTPLFTRKAGEFANVVVYVWRCARQLGIDWVYCPV